MRKLGTYLDYYVDRDGTTGIDEVSSRAWQKKFRPLQQEDFSFGFTDAAIWLRAAVVNRTGRDFDWILECEYPLIDDICFFAPEAGSHTSVCTGDLKPFSMRPVKSRTFEFPVTSPPDESAYYIRMSSGGAMNISFTAWTREELRDKNTHESVLLWIHYGIMIAFIIYNLFIFLSVRDLSYLYLSLFTLSISFGTMSLNGLAFQYLWPEVPAWGNIANLVFTGFNGIFAILFTRTFLETRARMPRYDRFLLAAGVYIIGCFLLFFFKYEYAVRIMSFNIGIILLVLISCGLYLMLKGSRQARFFMLGWLGLLLGAMLMVLHSFGVIHEAFFSVWGVQIGTTILVILLSLGIADKINIMSREREQALEASRDAEEKYQALIETTDTGYAIFDEPGRVIDANMEFVRLTGHLTIDDIIGKTSERWFQQPEKIELFGAMLEKQGFIRDFEIDFVHQNGTTVPVEFNATAIETTEGKRILAICRDITNRRAIFENLMSSLHQKEVLLKEVHHRVKNNLQIISSLLNLQANKITDAGTLRLYDDMNNRIRAMSIIHERMYQSSDFARVDLADYIRTIADDLRATYATNCPRCEMIFDTTPIFMELTHAIPCGLMINEILTNTFKYAFTPDFTGSPAIVIALHETDDDGVELIIGDNGVGLPDGIDPEKVESLGLNLIHLLAQQLRGTLAIDRTDGTRYSLRFTLTHYA
ncbi:MAG: PAS domain S-box protein [Spirochaetes bacterium]|nr:PAS domain S-box protein [Spirochaetota bacterium]